MKGSFFLSASALWRREMVRFVRQRSRIVGAFASPLIFWLLLGFGVGSSFSPASQVRAMGYQEYFFPGTGLMILLFLRKTEEARQAFLQVPQEELPPWDDGWYVKFLDYNCGRITADVLLQAAGQSRPKVSDARFMIGLWRLSEGDRFAARDHFEKSVATRVFNSWEWPWVRAFLARMEQDRAWPPWIPLKN